jgi:hypothetical protein
MDKISLNKTSKMNAIKYITTNEITNPKRLVRPYGWIGHIPFLQWLIAEVRPNNYVELGVHSGNSFCAGAVALKLVKPSAKAYAIDTWEGDHQASHYGEEIYLDLCKYIKQNLAENSVMIRKYFDDAVSDFQDKSIDLLHIDGLHTYEAVSNDFSKWLSKMSNTGVILFHDIAEKKADFGVWKLWSELKTRYTSFEFDHNHGLGVLMTGSKVHPSLAEISGYSTDEMSLFKRIFEMHGTGVYRYAFNDIYSLLRKEEKTASELIREIGYIKSSISWKITRPLRFLRDKFM